MSTTKWTSGQALTNKLGEKATFNASIHLQEVCEAAGWRAVDPPVDAPAEKGEPVDGWIRASSVFRCERCRAETVFCQLGAPYKRSCEACAPTMGVFAPPAPAKPVRPADDDTAAWEALVPKAGLPDTGDKAFAVGEVWAFATSEHTACVAFVTKLLPDGCCVSVLAGLHAGDTRKVVTSPFWIAKSKRLFPADAARAKPAEPKPAPTEKVTYTATSEPNGYFGPPSEPAPAEKAKREWKAPAEMKNGKLDIPAAASVFARTITLDNGCVRLDLERIPGRPATRTRYDQETDAHGKLSRLVESGLRADARQDETRFEAGIRGPR